MTTSSPGATGPPRPLPALTIPAAEITPGGGATWSTTSMVRGLLTASGAVTVIVPRYVPGSRPAGSTETESVAFVEPAEAATFRNPPLLVAVNGIAVHAVTD